MTRLESWHGDEITARIERATREAIDEATAEAAASARDSHWWRSRSGQLEAEIINEPAKGVGDEAVGRFGTTQRRGFYGLFMERRTPFLRPAADEHFKQLAKRIRRRL